MTRPLKRKGPKGSLDFEAISWDQALDEIAGKVLDLKDQYGPECIASFIGRGNFEESIRRMFTPKTKGFSVGNSLFMPLGSPNAFSVGSLCYISYGVLAPISTFGAPMGALVSDMEHADVIFVWGTNPATDSPLTDMIRLMEAKKRGAKIVVIDPLKTTVARDADLWAPIRPGTDMALIYGILLQCFNKGAVDHDFGRDFCQGFDELKEYVTRFTPEVVEGITRVPKSMIEELAGIMSSTGNISFLSYTGLEYSNIGVQTIRMLLTLWALTGHLDVAGGQRIQMPLAVPFKKPDVQFPAAVAPIGADKYPFYFQLTNSAQFMEFPGSVLDGDPYKIRFLLIGGASILTSFPLTPIFKKALSVLDYQVCVDIFLNADACFADIVLPATTYYEMSSLCCYQNAGPYQFATQYRKKVIEPIGEAKSSYLIYASLAERLGYGHYYPQSEDGMVEYLIQDLPIDFEEFKTRSEHGPIPLYQDAAKPYEEKKWLTGKLRRDGKPGFSTPSGKWEIRSSLIEKAGYSPFPVYKNMTEGPDNTEMFKDYPLTLTTGARLQSSFRSQHLNIPGLLKLQPNAEVLIHKEDAGPRGIVTGDRVIVVTERGEAIFTAHVTEDILAGVVEVNQGGGTPIQAEGWRDSNVNILTDDKNRDPLSGFPVFKALLCQVKKS
ncbi:putative anaerobic dehydrogenase [uncultured Desulfobacterium sp.]|uniref:Putative anaerobic dehydrogenase n=1 Tax=uncultured Desulfobacterium sp. TaxID=201089 RepID=A0A445N0L5_9BACT|nr:putative anaerobic dehydrogenase [uncultured Desulfobacterium sp.]